MEKEKKPINHMGRKQRLDTIFAYCLLMPSIITAIVFYIYVNLSSFGLAFIRNDEFAGWYNFELLISEMKMPGSTIAVSIENTFLFFIRNLVMFVWGILIAYFFYKKVAGTDAIRIIWSLPGLITGMVYVLLYKTMVEPGGPIEELIQIIDPNFVMPQLLGRSDTARWTILVYTIWMGWGANMLYLGGTFARIPLEVLESARLDGVGPWKELVHIIIPMVLPTLSTLFLLEVLGLLGAGGPILLFTQGAYNTSTLNYWMFTLVFDTGRNQYALASAAGMMMTAFMLPIALFVRWLTNRVEDITY